ncbi:MAG TPA: signal peptide peptidase SppA [Brumimicrobium sp.]|nr:signal peptide peptidase SppA [Brumimicrobium sp.]
MTNNKVSFWRIFWPSLLAGVALIILGFMFFTTIIGSIVSSMTPKQPTHKDAVLHLKLTQEVREISSNEVTFDFSSIGVNQTLGLADLLYGFEKAAEDDEIKGVFIELSGAYMGYSTATELRNAIKQFEEESGKFVVAYHSGEATSLMQYYIASAASENYGFHSTNFEFLGLGAELMFFKGLFDKLDIEMQVIRGSDNDFKSAVEPYYLTEMSDSSKLQMEVYINNIWTEIKKNIGEDRGISIEALNLLAEEGSIRRMLNAVEHNLVNDVKYRDEVLQLLADKADVKEVDDLNLKSFESYATNKFHQQQNIVDTKDANIAVIIADGAITVDGDGIASNRLTKLIREARNDEDIKTIVLRVNSPGGSALASDEIWREVKLANEEKSVVVSMGDVAASGGYYIAAPAGTIFAQETTITGSIGVFGVIPFIGNTLENKLGITFDRIATNKYASALSLNRKLSPEEFSIVQSEVDFIYDEFLHRVSEGRNMTKEQVNVVARGRVWTGTDALQVGLVDKLGGINDAIEYAAKEAGIEKPVIQYYPKVKKEPWMEFVELLNEDKNANFGQKGNISQEFFTTFMKLKDAENWVGIQARLPYYIVW